MTRDEVYGMLQAMNDVLFDVLDVEKDQALLENICPVLNNWLGYHGIATFAVQDTNTCDGCLPLYEIVQISGDN